MTNWLGLVGLLMVSASLSAQTADKKSSPVPASSPAASSTTAVAPPAVEATKKDGAPKKVKKKKKSKEIVEPKDLPPAVETTKIEPSFLYRIGGLKPVIESVFHKDDHGDLADQIYLTLRYTKVYNFVHRVHIEPSFRTLRNNPATWEDFVVEQAYIETELFTPLVVTAGKKTEYEGSGFVVNPSDLLNENKDIFDPVYQNEGEVFTRFKLRTEPFTLGLGFIPLRGHPSKRGKFWGQFSTEFFEIDLRLQYTSQESDKSTTGFSIQRFFGGSFELHLDGRYQARQRSPETEGNDYVIYSAYAGPKTNDQGDDDASGYYLGGSRFIFTPRRSLVLEYIVNQAGLLPEEFENYFGDLRTKKDEESKVRDPQTRLIGRHYGFVSYQDDDSLKNTHLAINLLTNSDDHSAFLSAAARYYVSPITSVELAPTLFKGGRNSEFGEMPFSHAVYLVFRGRF